MWVDVECFGVRYPAAESEVDILAMGVWRQRLWWCHDGGCILVGRRRRRRYRGVGIVGPSHSSGGLLGQESVDVHGVQAQRNGDLMEIVRGANLFVPMAVDSKGKILARSQILGSKNSL